jgi:CTP synthase
MRLGLYPAKLSSGSRAAEAYGAEIIYERHRHRFEVNNEYRQQLERAGMVLSGQSPDGRLVEIVELADHPWFVASQFHPEFRSRPDRPHPLFAGFVKASIEREQSVGAVPAGAGGNGRRGLAEAGLETVPVADRVRRESAETPARGMVRG